MFNTALIVFRETLEAALFVGIIAAATRQVVGRGRLLAAGIVAGVMGAFGLAMMAERIAAAADGIGQDLANVGILTIALAMLMWHCIWVSTHGKEQADGARRLGTSVTNGQRTPWALMIAVALAILREGAETVLFVAGTTAGSPDVAAASMLGACAVGVGAGAVLGLLVYKGLSRIPPRKLFAVTNVLIAFLAASIASQLARALAQAGLVERWTSALWDTAAAISPDSALGTTLHALIGYDARPSGLQVVAYLGVLALIYVGTRLGTGAAAAPRAGRLSGA